MCITSLVLHHLHTECFALLLPKRVGQQVQRITYICNSATLDEANGWSGVAQTDAETVRLMRVCLKASGPLYSPNTKTLKSDYVWSMKRMRNERRLQWLLLDRCVWVSVCVSFLF